MSDETKNTCQTCGVSAAWLYELYSFAAVGEPAEPEQRWLCVSCARRERQAVRAKRTAQLLPPNDQLPEQMTRAELIAALDQFWAESGAGEICRRCHEQGTGCCPPMCRHLGSSGCLKKNVFCTSFVCSALLNAIAECDPDTGRLLKWIKRNPGAAEFRIYEMVTRVPAVDREEARPLVVPEKYPGPMPLSGPEITDRLLSLVGEVLWLRRHWSQAERQGVISPSEK